MLRERLLLHPGIRVLQAAVRREQYRQLVLFGLLLASGFVFCTVALGQHLLLTMLGMVFIVLSVAALFYIWKHWHDDRLLRLLRYQPRQIVWIYPVHTQWKPLGIRLLQRSTLYIKLSSGEAILIGVTPRKIRLVCRTLHRLLPHTTFGYTRERAELFRKSPISLLRDEL